MRNTLLIIYLLLNIIHSFGQKENYNWYFGENAGLQFSDTNSQPTTFPGAVNAREESTSISDENGNLLFHTYGETVYNQNQQVMLNRRGLLGDDSTVQSSLIFKYPNKNNLYYLFTNDAFSGPLNYYTIDMNLDNGLGGVVQPAVGSKNTQLLKHTSERMAAITKDCNGKSLWLITHANDDEN